MDGELFEEHRPLRLTDQKMWKIHQKAEKAEKEDDMELSSRGSQVDRNHHRPFRVCGQHEGGKRVHRLKQAKQTGLLSGA